MTKDHKGGARIEPLGEKGRMDLSTGNASRNAEAGASARPSPDPAGSDTTRPGSKHPDGGHGLSSDLQAHIGRQLRATFDEVAREPIPDRFLQLLKDLEESGPKK